MTKTMTSDNGVEFQRDDLLQRQLGAPIYFTEPSAPWQRGSIENLNGLDNLPTWAPKAIEETLNYRPRKTLDYQAPPEVFFEKNMALMKTNHLLRLGLEFNGGS